MARSTARRPHPLSMRLPASDMAVIDRAANLRGRSRTDFIREAAVRAAEDTILETALIRMSPAGFKSFSDAISRPPSPVPEMVELLKKPAPWQEKPKPGR